MIVDDEDQMREMIEVLLQDAGYETEGIASGDELSIALTGDQPDVVLLDLRLPTRMA